MRTLPALGQAGFAVKEAARKQLWNAMTALKDGNL